MDDGPDGSLLRFITCGSTDDSKSTLIGRLLVDANVVPDDRRASAPAAASLIDGLAEGFGYDDALAAKCRPDQYSDVSSTLRQLLPLSLFALASCADRETTQVGFLSTDYGKLQRTKANPEHLCLSPGYVPTNYTKIAVGPVASAEGAAQCDTSVVENLRNGFAWAFDLVSELPMKQFARQRNRASC